MKVYLAVDNYREIPRHLMHVCPAGDEHFVTNPPAEFLDTETGKPKQFTVDFAFGVAEVSEGLGEYMCQRKLARRTGLMGFIS